MGRILAWPKKTIQTLHEEGLSGLTEKVGLLIKEFSYRFRKKVERKTKDNFFDVLFINGCDHSVPHPIRYRVDHQREQLSANGVYSDCIFYQEVTLDDVRRARSFVIFRCPYTETVGAFIALAKQLNKKVYFDIDDLVIDTQYTDTIEYLDTMTPEERAGYDSCVRDMGKTLSLCDAAITTTEHLAAELKKFVPEVYVNRNTASEKMLYYSQQAIYRRDVLPCLPENQVPFAEKKLYEKIKKQKNLDSGEISIGYFSGSITHNDDIAFLLPVLIRVFENRPQVKLCFVGELDLPSELEPYKERITASPFVSWNRLPGLIAQVDINIVPLRDTVFNAAKSENKWVEASLVKIPTVASDMGAFARMIEDGKTGLLCRSVDDWYEAITRLVDDGQLRQEIAQKSYEFCMENCLTITTGYGLTHYLTQNAAPNIAMVVPSLQTSGGINVMLKHCEFLQDAGYDVSILNTDDCHTWVKQGERSIPVLNRVRTIGKVEDAPLEGHFDKGVATFWDTLDFIEKYPNFGSRYYLVQNFETDFYPAPEPLRLEANATYVRDVTYITISKWCEKWLTNNFHREVRYASNGLSVRDFWSTKRRFEGRIRILIEGDFSKHKNVEESFRIVDKLDPDKFEIWYMSYMPKPKGYYRIDNFVGSVPHDEVADVYRACHILLKTSVLESFSYPPLEMMATGGYVVVLPNDGNVEYLKDGYNCLYYEQGNLEQAVSAIERICSEGSLRDRLYSGGQETAARYDWDKLRDSICDLYQ